MWIGNPVTVLDYSLSNQLFLSWTLYAVRQEKETCNKKAILRAGEEHPAEAALQEGSVQGCPPPGLRHCQVSYPRRFHLETLS
jgi:hypothetical protein